jgi:glyoxylase-like metal-dependent hydrolase (beta-lactamase superfamily II)
MRCELPGANSSDVADEMQDPRQYILPSGISYTSLESLLDGESSPRNHNEILSLPGTSNIYTITTIPKFAIGQRAFFIKTPKGNILWDCVTLMDEPTQHFINANGGLKAIVISHPHFYSTHMYWARTFNCKVHTAREDAKWLHFDTSRPEYQFLDKPTEVIVPGITAIKVGGHFPGSLVLHLDGGDGKRLFIADSMFTVPSGNGPFEYPPEGIITYSFMWSIPNMVRLRACLL